MAAEYMPVPPFLVFRSAIIAFFLAVATASAVRVPIGIAVAFGIAAFGLLFFRKTDRYRAVIVAVLLAAALGLIRTERAFRSINAQTIGLHAGAQRTLKGVVFDVDRRRDRTYLGITLADASVSGRMRITTGRYERLSVGDRVRFRCRVQIPEKVQAFDYPAYLRLSGITATCSPREIAVLGQEPPGKLQQLTGGLRAALTDHISALWPEPSASFLAGLLVGDRSGLPPGLQDAFKRTGTMHILAISGYNISLIAHLLQRFLNPWIGRKRATPVILAGLVLFTLLTGASASVVRAALMGGILVVGEHLGRVRDGVNALLAAACGMVAASPFILLDDVGFQLSCAATFGLLVLAEPIAGFLRRLPNILGFRETLAATLAATFLTLPITAVAFGQVSLIAPLANVLVLPLVPWAMAAGAIALAVGFLSPQVGVVAGSVAWLILSLAAWMTTALANLPWSSLPMPALPPWLPVALYAGGGLVWYGVRVKQWKSHATP